MCMELRDANIENGGVIHRFRYNFGRGGCPVQKRYQALHQRRCGVRFAIMCFVMIFAWPTYAAQTAPNTPAKSKSYVNASAAKSAPAVKSQRKVAARTTATRSASRAAVPKQLALHSSSAIVIDQLSGTVVYDKNADEQVPIASLTKLMTAMVVMDAKLPLDELVRVSSDDIDRLRGSRSRLPVGTQLPRRELIRLALMASENRAASALGRVYPGGPSAFIAAMNRKARTLGLTRTNFADSSGLSSSNVSTARELSRIVAAAYDYPIIREYSTDDSSKVKLPRYAAPVQFRNTNGLVKNRTWDIGLSKTGYTSDAGHCLVMQADIANRPLILVLLDSWGKNSRIGDANRIRKWVERNPTKLQLAG